MKSSKTTVSQGPPTVEKTTNMWRSEDGAISSKTTSRNNNKKPDKNTGSQGNGATRTSSGNAEKYQDRDFAAGNDPGVHMHF